MMLIIECCPRWRYGDFSPLMEWTQAVGREFAVELRLPAAAPAFWLQGSQLPQQWWPLTLPALSLLAHIDGQTAVLLQAPDFHFSAQI